MSTKFTHIDQLKELLEWIGQKPHEFLLSDGMAVEVWGEIYTNYGDGFSDRQKEAISVVYNRYSSVFRV